MLTVYGIETIFGDGILFLRCVVATVLTVYGIETAEGIVKREFTFSKVATVLTVYGIETLLKWLNLCQKQHF